MLIARLAALVALSFAVACASPTSDSAAGSESADTALSNAGIQNFTMVRPGLYRGGHPDAAGLDFLKSRGVKRIVNLEVGDFAEAFPWDISRELDEARQRGLTELRFPMSAFEPAISGEFNTHMDQIAAILKTATPSDGVYVHCKHGQDRTGLVIGLERVIDEKWAPKAAYAEMLHIGFHPMFLGLSHYFEEKTGFKD